MRKPTHPGIVLEEHYIVPLELNLEDLADSLKIARNTLYKIRKGKARVTADIALRLAQAFNTSPDLWLNLQQKFDLWEVFRHKSFISKIPQIYPIPRRGQLSRRTAIK